MLAKVLWLIRFAGLAVVGVLALTDAPSSRAEQAVQIACFTAASLAMVAWLLVGERARYRSWGLPVILGVMAFACGLSGVTSGSGQSLVAFAVVAALAAGTECELPAALAVTAAGIVPIEIAGLITGSTIGTLIGYPLIIVVGLLAGRNRRGYRVQAQQSAALLAQYERLQAEHRRADVLDERGRIAREIHDVLAHSLGALGIQIQAARAVLTDHRDVDRALEVLATAQRMAADGLVETRRAVHALRVDTRPLDAELAGLVDTHRQRYHAPVTFETAGAPRPLPPDATLALLRTAQEALVNAAKHASGQQIAVRLDYGETDVRLTVVNHLNGTHAGIQGPTSSGGYGLTGMRERLRLLNGTLLAGPQGDEWDVTAELPLTPPERTAR